MTATTDAELTIRIGELGDIQDKRFRADMALKEHYSLAPYHRPYNSGLYQQPQQPNDYIRRDTYNKSNGFKNEILSLPSKPMYGTEGSRPGSDIDNYDLYSLPETITGGGRTYQRKGNIPEKLKGPPKVDPSYQVAGLRIVANFVKVTNK